VARPHLNEDFGENKRALELFLHRFMQQEKERFSRHTTSKNIEAIFRKYGLRGSFSPHQTDNSSKLLRKQGLLDENGNPARGSIQRVLDMWQRSYGRQRFDPSWRGPTDDDLRLAAIVWHHSDAAALRAGKLPLTYASLPEFFRRGRRMLAHGRVRGMSFKETNQFKLMFECLRRDWESFSLEEKEIARERFHRFERRLHDVDRTDDIEEYDLRKTMMFPFLLPC